MSKHYYILEYRSETTSTRLDDMPKYYYVNKDK